MPDTLPIQSVIGLPPDETVAAFRARDDLRVTNRWSEMWHGDHARAFTVAKVAKLDLLDTIRGSLDDVIANGGTFEQWQERIVPELQKAGWWGDVTDRDLTGADHPIVVGPRRLRTIFDTNLRMSRAAGRWTRIQALKDQRPYLRYTAVMDARTRPQHRIWHGTILPVDHPWWDTHFPPCGWNCRCTVRQLSDRDLVRHGWHVTDPPREGPPRLFYRAGSPTPVAVPAGISPGFAYNPGKAHMAAVADKATRTIEASAALDISAARTTLDELVQSDAFLQALDEPGASFPVMVLDDASRAAIGADARVAVLSSDTYTKQRGRHPELTVADYRKLPSLGAGADIVAVEGDTILKFARLDGERWLVAVVKRTASGAGLFVTSYRVQNQASLKRLLAGTTVLYDGR
ncbi:MAG TPA: phage minor head protein [Sphingomonas sp.]|nr:phage minor head protein [Sphingomonas sp.]